MKVLICLSLVLAIAQANPAYYSSYPEYSSSYSYVNPAEYSYEILKREAAGPEPTISRERRAVATIADANKEDTSAKAKVALARDGRDLLISSDRYGYSSYPYSSYSYGLGLGSRYVSDYSYPRYTYSGLRDYSGLSSSSLYYI